MGGNFEKQNGEGMGYIPHSPDREREMSDKKYVFFFLLRDGMAPDVRETSTYVVYKDGDGGYNFANLIFTIEAERAKKIASAFMSDSLAAVDDAEDVEIVAHLQFTGTNLPSSYTKLIWENRDTLETLVPEFFGADGCSNYMKSLGQIRTLYLDHSTTERDIINVHLAPL